MLRPPLISRYTVPAEPKLPVVPTECRARLRRSEIRGPVIWEPASVRPTRTGAYLLSPTKSFPAAPNTSVSDASALFHPGTQLYPRSYTISPILFRLNPHFLTPLSYKNPSHEHNSCPP